MQELMSRHKAYSLNPRDCLKTTLFQKWQRMVAPPGKRGTLLTLKFVLIFLYIFVLTTNFFMLYFYVIMFKMKIHLKKYYLFLDAQRPPNKRRKRKGSNSGSGANNAPPVPNKKRSPGPNFSLASQVVVSLYKTSFFLNIHILKLFRKTFFPKKKYVCKYFEMNFCVKYDFANYVNH